jgi:hypothetical protein
MEQFEIDTRLGQLRYPYATTSKILDFCVVGRGAPVEPIRISGGSPAKGPPSKAGDGAPVDAAREYPQRRSAAKGR